MRFHAKFMLVAGLVSAVCSGGTSANADSVKDFYAGKQLTVSIGFRAGGGYDIQARLIGRHIGPYIPGSPTVVPQNNPGAGGLRNVKYLYEAAPRDGSVIGMVTDSTPLAQAMRFKGADYNAKELNWLGAIAPSVGIIMVWHAKDVRTVEDARKTELIAGSNGQGVATYIFPTLMNHFAGTKFKVVTGYSGGSEINIALERGEVDARFNALASLKASNPQWLEEKKVHVIAQIGPRTSEVDAPSLIDFAKNDEERRIINLMSSRMQLGRPLVTPPAVPEDKVAALRKAFDETMNDSKFREQAAKLDLEVDPVRGTELQAIVGDLVDIPEPVVVKARKILNW